jgi:hypothetical protein
MKTNFFKWTLAIALLCVGFVACKDDDDPVVIPEIDDINLNGKAITGLDLRTVFAPAIKEGAVVTFQIVSQPKKIESGPNTTAKEVVLADIFVIANDGYTLLAKDSLPPAFEYKGIKREIVPAVVRLSVGGKEVEAPVVWTESRVELIAIELADDGNLTGNISTRIIPGTNTFTVGLPYAPSTSGSTGLGISKAGSFKGIYSDGSIDDNLANSNVILEGLDHEPQPGEPEYHEGATYYPDGGYYMYLEKYVIIEAENSNGSPIAPEATSGVTKAENAGHPINAAISYSAGRVTGESFYVGDPEFSTVGETGTIFVYPYGTSKDDFRTLKLTAKTVSVTGITAAPENFIYNPAITIARRFKVNTQAALQAAFYAYLTVSEGPARLYSSSAGAEGNNGYMLVVADSWNKIDGVDVIEGAIGTNPLKNNSLLKPDQTDNTVLANYAGFHSVQLSAKGKTLPANTTITFKVCPKNRFTNGVPDPSWTATVTTKIYAE